MKKRLLIYFSLLCLSASIFGCDAKTKSEVNNMRVTSSGIDSNGVIADKYGVNNKEGIIDGIPAISLPLQIQNAPAGTVSFTIFMEDKDAFPVSHGFSWIHWVAADIDAAMLNIPENASRLNPTFVQGVNSWWSYQGGSREELKVSYYGGMAPPVSDGPHTYEITVYALDTKLNLKNGFYMNDMFKGMQGHILGQAVLKGTYKSK